MIPDRLGRWFAVLVATLLAVAPDAGLVLCFEPDGTVVLESAGAERACDGCDDRTSGERSARVVSPAGDCCACLDIPVDGVGDEVRVAPAPVEPCLDPPVALAFESSVSPLAPFFERVSLRASRPPGPPGSLAHLRTVVLRV